RSIYEQALQIAAMEMLRHLLGTFSRPPRELFDRRDEVSDPVWHSIRDQMLKLEFLRGLGLSGAQFGAASWLAGQFWMRGPRGLLALAKREGARDRIIQVSRSF